MKKTLLFIVLILANLNFAQNVNIPDANFKNALLAHGVTITGSDISIIDTNNDGEIQITEAEAYSYKVKVTNKNISDLTGIEAFINITSLECNLNQLTSLDVSNNTALGVLNCNNNQLSSLDVSQNISLMFLYCKTNLLTSLNVSANTSLFYLYCGFNQISSLDLSNNTDLGLLSCTNNQLTSLNIANGQNWKLNDFYATNNPNLTCIQIDNTPKSTWEKDAIATYSTDCTLCLSINIPDANFKTYLVNNSAINTNGDSEIQCSEASIYSGVINCESMAIQDLTGIEAFTALKALFCGFNYITNLDVSQNTELIILRCSENQLTNLDLSANLALIEVICSENQLTNLNVSQNIALKELRSYNNQLTSLNVANGNNSNMTNAEFYAFGNPNLTCIQVDDVAYSTANWTNIDTWATYSTNCALNTNDFELLKQVTIYPNPAKDHFQVDLENSLELKTITVYNNLGQQVLTTNSPKVNASSLSKGMYYVEIVTNSGKANKKIIIE